MDSDGLGTLGEVRAEQKDRYGRTQDGEGEAVSYTHLTLPTNSYV